MDRLGLLQVPVGVAVQQPGGEYAYGTAQRYGGGPAAGAPYHSYGQQGRGFEPDSVSRV